MQASLATQNCPCFYSSLIANRTFQKGSLLCCFFYYYFYGRDVSCVSLFSQNFRGDPDIFNREFSLEEPAPTTSTTSTAWLIDCPRALTVRVFDPLLKCIITAV